MIPSSGWTPAGRRLRLPETPRHRQRAAHLVALQQENPPVNRLRAIRRPAAVVAALPLAVLSALSVVGPVAAHEARAVNGYDFEVGLIDEPVYVGNKSGLEFFVRKGGQPVTGLEQTLKATVAQAGATRDLPLTADDDDVGRYFSSFIPTVAGKYTFHITGTLPDGSKMDATFTSSPTGFNEVQEVASGQFPAQFPSTAELAAQAKQGYDAAGQVTIALALGGLGVFLGLAALGVAFANRSRSAKA
jgi:hypothetical protein